METEYHHKSYSYHDNTNLGSFATFNVLSLFMFFSKEKIEDKNNPAKHYIKQSEDIADLIDVFHEMKKVSLDWQHDFFEKFSTYS